MSGSAHLPDPAALAVAADNLTVRGDSFANTVEGLHGSWRGGLEQSYQAPEQEQVHALLTGPRVTAQALRDSTQQAAQALRLFAEGAAEIISRRKMLIEQLENYGHQIYAQADPAVDEALFTSRANTLADDYRELEDACINALDALQRNTTDAFATYGPRNPDADVNAATAAYNRLADGRSRDLQRDLGMLLRRMDLMTLEELNRFKADNPGWELATAPAGLDPEATKELWASLRHPEFLITALPLLVGNLEGIPYVDRAEANLLALGAAAARHGLTTEQEAAYATIRKSLVSPFQPLSRFLIAFDPSVVPPLAAVSIGNVDDADYVAVNVPGMEATSERMTDWTDAAQGLYDGQGEVDANSSHAVVAWMNYSTPGPLSTFEVLHSDLARAGGDRLAVSLTGFHTALGDGPFLAVAAHSYGTPTAGNGLANIDFEVDAAVLYASAGMDSATPDAENLRVAVDSDGNPQVYATQASADNLAGLGILGSQLAGDGRLGAAHFLFGAKVFSSDGDGVLAPTDEHTPFTGRVEAVESQGYLDRGTESLNSISKITMGRGGLVEVTGPFPRLDIEQRRLTHPQLFGPRF
ncbi:alpha/beta hydrolase [Arthrobacter gengyunqii]|uniref:Alpha/beta hydrolase family protein n=1 Tax=Arthrobacter gengyunqii TaxID=2886940 RepID=A0ABS8GFC7_9MICC|nr:alpha/beta hydrolase [Arthrobacter gengyunqii]MCC3265294.1 alpha/beta hydrolase family protein [Arthrobacter gengyunqii]